ncbi:MAG: hypothetical protein EOO04_38295, partial [Chitinophagaceae bacterium]
MNQSNHPIQEVTLRPASFLKGSDANGDDYQRSDIIRWAGTFYNNSYQPICILEMSGHDIIFTNQAFRSHINKSFAVNELRELLTEDSGNLVAKAIANLNGEPTVLSGIYLASDPGKVFELVVSRLSAGEELVTIAFN